MNFEEACRVGALSWIQRKLAKKETSAPLYANFVACAAAAASFGHLEVLQLILSKASELKPELFTLVCQRAARAALGTGHLALYNETCKFHGKLIGLAAEDKCIYDAARNEALEVLDWVLDVYNPAVKERFRCESALQAALELANRGSEESTHLELVKDRVKLESFDGVEVNLEALVPEILSVTLKIGSLDTLQWIVERSGVSIDCTQLQKKFIHDEPMKDYLKKVANLQQLLGIDHWKDGLVAEKVVGGRVSGYTKKL